MMKNEPTVLIITPSLNPEDNISGISFISNLLIKENTSYKYIPFIVGKKDKEKRDFFWLISLLQKPFSLLFSYIGKLSFVHFNIGFEPKSLLRDVVLFFILWVRSVPIVLHIHGGRYMNKNSIFYQYIIRFLIQKSKYVIVLSELEKSFLLRNYKNIGDSKIFVIPNAIVVPPISEVDKDFDGVLSILFLGRIDKAKGLAKIIDALSLLSNDGIPFVFNLCGIGPDKEWFVSSLQDIVNVVDEGVVYGGKKDNIINKSLVYILPSDFEGLPLSMLECMGRYVVPVVTSVGSIPEVVDINNGRLISTALEIKSAIEELNSNRDLLRTLAVNARKTIENKYSSDSFVHRINVINALMLS